jgi:hypothetical protein
VNDNAKAKAGTSEIADKPQDHEDYGDGIQNVSVFETTSNMKSALLFLFITLFLQNISKGQSKTYVLVHGGWHGAGKKVVPLLEIERN